VLRPVDVVLPLHAEQRHDIRRVVQQELDRRLRAHAVDRGRQLHPTGQRSRIARVIDFVRHPELQRPRPPRRVQVEAYQLGRALCAGHLERHQPRGAEPGDPEPPPRDRAHVMQHAVDGRHAHRQLDRRHRLVGQARGHADDVLRLVDHELRIAPGHMMPRITPRAHPVARGQPGHARPDRLDCARRLVARLPRRIGELELVADEHRLRVPQVQVPLRAGGDRVDAHQHFARPGLGDRHIVQDRLARPHHLENLHVVGLRLK